MRKEGQILKPGAGAPVHTHTHTHTRVALAPYSYLCRGALVRHGTANATGRFTGNTIVQYLAWPRWETAQVLAPPLLLRERGAPATRCAESIYFVCTGLPCSDDWSSRCPTRQRHAYQLMLLHDQVCDYERICVYRCVRVSAIGLCHNLPTTPSGLADACWFRPHTPPAILDSNQARGTFGLLAFPGGGRLFESYRDLPFYAPSAASCSEENAAVGPKSVQGETPPVYGQAHQVCLTGEYQGATPAWSRLFRRDSTSRTRATLADASPARIYYPPHGMSVHYLGSARTCFLPHRHQLPKPLHSPFVRRKVLNNLRAMHGAQDEEEEGVRRLLGQVATMGSPATTHHRNSTYAYSWWPWPWRLPKEEGSS